MPTAIVITVSDSRSAGRAEDRSGPAVEECLRNIGLDVIDRRIVPDERSVIADAVLDASRRAAAVVLTGGTGVGPRDVTPEAVEPLYEKALPGFGEIMRTGSFAKTPLSILSRGGAGVVGRSLVILLPGSPGGVRDGLELLGPAIKHVLKVLTADRVDCVKEAGHTG